jgi:hypothetical protein
MPKVNLPRGDWETVLFILKDSEWPYITSLINDIETQVYSQEY